MGWPLLTVETETNGDSKSTNELGPSLVGSLGYSCRKDFCPALAGLVGPLQNTVLLTVHCFDPFVPIAQQAGQAAALGRLSLIMRLYDWYYALCIPFIPHFCLSHRKKEKNGFFLQ
jgi:hypothetical protein